jgi:hypothetical protein
MAAIEIEEKLAARLRSEAEARNLPLSEYLQGLSFLKSGDQSQAGISESEFRTLADQWQRETRKLSSIEKIVLHPAYQKIIGMGREALPMILRELKTTRGHWLWALVMITREDIAQPGQSFREACDEWVRWGEAKGYI